MNMEAWAHSFWGDTIQPTTTFYDPVLGAHFRGMAASQTALGLSFGGCKVEIIIAFLRGLL